MTVISFPTQNASVPLPELPKDLPMHSTTRLTASLTNHPFETAGKSAPLYVDFGKLAKWYHRPKVQPAPLPEGFAACLLAIAAIAGVVISFWSAFRG